MQAHQAAINARTKPSQEAFRPTVPTGYGSENDRNAGLPKLRFAPEHLSERREMPNSSLA
jgi:hypothetical protein